MKKITLVLVTAALLLGVTLVGVSSPAEASGGDATVRTGNCSG